VATGWNSSTHYYTTADCVSNRNTSRRSCLPMRENTMTGQLLVLRVQDWRLTDNGTIREGVSISYIPVDSESLSGDSRGYSIINATLPLEAGRLLTEAPAIYDFRMVMGTLKDSQKNTRQTIKPVEVLKLIGRVDIFSVLKAFVAPGGDSK
jgi:hypothetical protein